MNMDFFSITTIEYEMQIKASVSELNRNMKNSKNVKYGNSWQCRSKTFIPILILKIRPQI